MQILIISENRWLASLLARELRGEGIQASILCDPGRLWRHVTVSRPDLVLLDIDLESCNCWQLLLDLKSELRELPALVYVYKGPESFNKLKQAINAAAPRWVFTRGGVYRQPTPA